MVAGVVWDVAGLVKGHKRGRGRRVEGARSVCEVGEGL